MTTIAYADGLIAYDSRVTFGGRIITDDKDKLATINEHYFVFIGSICDHARLAEVYFDPKSVTEDDKKYNEAEAIVFNGSFAAEISIDKHCGLICSPLAAYPDAWGSGAAYALAGLRSGMTASEAVELAIKCDSNSGGKVRSVCFKHMGGLKK